METKPVPEMELNSGHKLPMIGFGTGSYRPPPPHELIDIFLTAIRAGYRHFDTAALYGTEEPLGQALGLALQQGLIKSRTEIFVTTKLWCSDAHPNLVLSALRSSLERLRLEYVDLYLVHFPVRLRRLNETQNFSKEDILPFDIKGTWEAMEECCKLGLAKSIGVSNFGVRKLPELLKHSTIPPAVLQVEMNVGWQQGNLLKFCKEKGIRMCAWSPLGASGASWGTNAVMESPILRDIATAIGKSVPQVALRWILQQGVTPIVRSFNGERMKQNLQIFDWELSEIHLENIKQIPQRRAATAEQFISENGPYKTLEDLWDGEI